MTGADQETIVACDDDEIVERIELAGAELGRIRVRRSAGLLLAAAAMAMSAAPAAFDDIVPAPKYEPPRDRRAQWKRERNPFGGRR